MKNEALNRVSATVSWSLKVHPSSAFMPELRITSALAREQGAWRLDYSVRGELDGWYLPEAVAQPRAVDGLWKHTCFEAFVGGGDDAYHEFNFSPSGHWAAYVFSAERERDLTAQPLHPVRIHCLRESRHLLLSAWLPDAALPLGCDGAPVGFSAVMEDRAGHLSYWALHHPAPHPDFHARSGWLARWPSRTG